MIDECMFGDWWLMIAWVMIDGCMVWWFILLSNYPCMTTYFHDYCIDRVHVSRWLMIDDWFDRGLIMQQKTNNYNHKKTIPVLVRDENDSIQSSFVLFDSLYRCIIVLVITCKLSLLKLWNRFCHNVFTYSLMKAMLECYYHYTIEWRLMIVICMVGWLIDWSTGIKWLNDWLRSHDWMIDRLIDSLIGWLIDWWLYDWLIHWECWLTNVHYHNNNTSQQSPITLHQQQSANITINRSSTIINTVK